MWICACKHPCRIKHFAKYSILYLSAVFQQIQGLDWCAWCLSNASSPAYEEKLPSKQPSNQAKKQAHLWRLCEHLEIKRTGKKSQHLWGVLNVYPPKLLGSSTPAWSDNRADLQQTLTRNMFQCCSNVPRLFYVLLLDSSPFYPMDATPLEMLLPVLHNSSRIARSTLAVTQPFV